MSNRVTDAIQDYEKRVAAQLAKAGVSPSIPTELNNLHRTLDLSILEFCDIQEIAHFKVFDFLTHDEVQTLYDLVGDAPEYFNRQSIATKSVLITVFKQLLEHQLHTRVERKTEMIGHELN